jgi:large subunit ribosomal protein L24
MIKFKIHKGDMVKVLSGKDKGKTGKVLAVFTKTGKVMVENLNVHTKFERSKQKNQAGTPVKVSSPMPVSKLQLIDSSTNKPTRVGFRIENGIKQRIAKKSGQPI